VNGQGPFVYQTDHIHFHGPGEHKIDGQQHDLELHFVHTLMVKDALSESYKQTLAVVGVIFKVGAQSHPFIEKLRIDDLGHIDRANVNELFDGKID
jgi:carbonic anhydrase